MKNILFFSATILLASCSNKMDSLIGKTSITKWQNDKQSAISITYDDGTINQFTVARPIMNKLGFPGTFYIITGKVEGAGKGQFIGRPKEEIIQETATTKTNADNFFERASLIGFTGTNEAVDYHSKAGSLYESGNITEAYAAIDEGFEKLRNSTLQKYTEVVYHDNAIDTTTWDDYKGYTAEGHEIASHTVTHPRLAALDETNLIYELQQSKDDIEKYLGTAYTFSAECPYGTENERVMTYAHKIYPALRNRMSETYLEELNRSSKKNPAATEKEYVQWQRGPLTDASMELMKSWVDTSISHDNIWLVLVFHGVDGVGWEPKTGTELEEYFGYIKEREPQLWVATFADVTKYIRARKNTTVTSKVQDEAIVVNLSSTLDPEIYHVPITLKTYVPITWKSTLLYKNQDLKTPMKLTVQNDDLGSYVLYNVHPKTKEIKLLEAG